ncbi:MAG TPA: DUF4202 family protein [Candidatus Saccharimonadales bacterium]|nr:DUF4202 family protein [Candidatus Saccharimonadales bacterium]
MSDSDLFVKVRTFVEESFNDKPHMVHFDRTVFWLKQLSPDADEALLIAAISHDIERASRLSSDSIGRAERGFLDKNDNTYHQEKGAEIVGEFLAQSGGSDQLITRVKHLVSKHEYGGDADQDLLKDADSLSFLENNAPIFLKRLDKLGYGKIKDKFDWMYDRISDPKAKKIAKPFYEKMIEKLENRAHK